jgi:polyamine oxidase
MVTVTDLESQRIERMSATEVKKEIVKVLFNMFGVSEEPIEILIPRWHQHPLFRGSYSNWPIGALQKHHMNMRAPLGNLWFAGEAMSADYYGFLHGAWLEGHAVANSIYQCFNGNCSTSKNYKYVTGCDNLDDKPKFLKQHIYY